MPIALTELRADRVKGDSVDLVLARRSLAPAVSGVLTGRLRPRAAVEALRGGRGNRRRASASASGFMTARVRRRGAGGRVEAERLLALGFERAALLDVVVGVAQKTLLTYIDHMAKRR